MKTVYDKIKLDLSHLEARELEFYGAPIGPSRDLEREAYHAALELVVKLKALLEAR